MTSLLEIADSYALTKADANGLAATPVAGLTVVRITAPSGIVHAIPRPMVCLVLQGRKHVAMGDRDFLFGAGDSLLITADVPTVSQVTQAAPGSPYLSLVVELDVGLVAAMTTEMEVEPAGAPLPVQVDPTEADVADAALRLMRLLQRPEAARMLAPQLIRELHYWLLAGRHGPAIRRLGSPGGPAGRIARAVEVLRAEFPSALPVERLAALAGMSVSSFHHHFRSVTSLSPLQFQKQLRLIEAKRLMMAEGRTAGAAAFAVGYESVSQFTREYGRMFGRPPARDAAAARRWAGAAA